MLIIRPCACLTRGRNVFVIRTIPIRLISNTCLNTFSGVISISAMHQMPALFTKPHRPASRYSDNLYQCHTPHTYCRSSPIWHQPVKAIDLQITTVGLITAGQSTYIRLLCSFLLHLVKVLTAQCSIWPQLVKVQVLTYFTMVCLITAGQHNKYTTQSM